MLKPHINRAQTPSEAYLHHLCTKTFLAPWSVASPYHSVGKELCDLLVIFGDDVLIFSDKTCAFPDSENLNLDWKRWFKKAVQKSAEQLWGAERRIRKYSKRIFLDAQCQKSLPHIVPLPPMAKFHLIVVAHGAGERCKKEFKGGSGSMILKTEAKGFSQHTEPFVIGDLDPKRTFVHVLDDTTLDFVMSELDTAPDFVSYLKKKEQLFRSGKYLYVTGEEELLARYQLSKGDKRYNFGLPAEADNIFLAEYDWVRYVNSPQWKARKEADRDSYIWDQIINNCYRTPGWFSSKFGTVLPSSLTQVESVVRIMASENRFRRRMLVNGYLDILKKSRKNLVSVRCIASVEASKACYLFFLLPREFFDSDEEYFVKRAYWLEAYCLITKSKFPDVEYVIGITNASGTEVDKRSEDVLFLDARNWSKDQQEYALRLQEKTGLLKETISRLSLDAEYPRDHGWSDLEPLYKWSHEAGTQEPPETLYKEKNDRI